MTVLSINVDDDGLEQMPVPSSSRRKSLRLAVARFFADVIQEQGPSAMVGAGSSTAARLNKLSRAIPKSRQQASAVIRAAKVAPYVPAADSTITVIQQQ